MGDTIPLRLDVNTPFGEHTATVYITLNSENCDKLVLHNIIRKENNLTLPLCMNLIADKLQCTVQEADSLLAGLAEAGMKATVLQMLVKTASEYLSPGIEVVKTLPKVFVFSSINGEIHEAPTSEIDNYDHFAYFVSKNQAKYVRRMLKDLFSNMYGKQENTKCSS